MAFKDITKVFYNGEIKVDYKDKAHRYYVRPRVDFSKSEDDPKAWGKIIYPKGTTALLGETLEKKGLMQWPKGVALGELFGFYDFTNEYGEQLTGFSKGKGTLWGEDGKLMPLNQEDALEPILSASKGWQRDQKKGADIGSVVHDAIEHFIKKQPFDIGEQYMWNIKEAEKDFIEGQAAALKKFKPTAKKTLADFEVKQRKDAKSYEVEHKRALEEFKKDVEMANKAFDQFKNWWTTTTPTLYGAEDLLYIMNVVHSKVDPATRRGDDCENRDVNGNCHCNDICGTYDGDIGIKAEHHPVFYDMGQKIIRVTADWKTSKASKSKEACMPEGISYDYFVQNAIYEKMRRRMGFPPADDLAVVSCRKDGGFTIIYASELSLTVGDCILWADSVINCFRYRLIAREGLTQHAEPQLNKTMEAF